MLKKVVKQYFPIKFYEYEQFLAGAIEILKYLATLPGEISRWRSSGQQGQEQEQEQEQE